MAGLPIRPVQDDLTSPVPLPRTLPRTISGGVTMALNPTPRALFFDVFGTCVDWRKSVVEDLRAQAHAALNSATASLASRVRLRASEMNASSDDWPTFAQQWRNSYKRFTRKLAQDASIPWKSVDQHHLESLKELMAEWKIEGLWDDQKLREISLIWHRLEPWSDSVMGVTLLNNLFWTCTLSNGNLSLLTDLRTFSKIPFTHMFSAEEFGTYKPAPEVYIGAANKLDLAPDQCVMVAAHLNDLKAAKQNGLQTIYVERRGEEDWDESEMQKAKQEGFVDLWVSGDDGAKGFIAVAEKLGIDISGTKETRRLSSSVPTGA